MSEWIPREDYTFADGELVVVCLLLPGWDEYAVRPARYYRNYTPHFYVEGYRWQADEYIRLVMPIPNPPPPPVIRAP